MRSRGLAEIIESTAEDESLGKGKYVAAHTNWSEYCVVNAKDCVPVSAPDGVNLTHFLGALGTTGLTAYYGLLEVAKATKDDAVVVSGAAGATGSMVVQIAKKMVGCKRVIGMAGSDDKCEWVRSLGADVCLNYKKDSFEADLVKATEGFVEVCFAALFWPSCCLLSLSYFAFSAANMRSPKLTSPSTQYRSTSTMSAAPSST